jgi:hypothetical protein
MSKQFQKELETLLEQLKKINPNYGDDISQISIRRHRVEEFMKETFDLYISVKNDSSIQAEPKFQSYISESANLLSELSWWLSDFITDAEKIICRSPFYGGEWEGVCWRRSAVEALKEMYYGTVLEEHFDEEDTEDLDLTMRSKCEMEGDVEKIPDGIPPSHWWWWCPDSPPETSVF